MPTAPRDVAVLVNPAADRGRAAVTGVRAVRAMRDLGLRVRVLMGRDAAESTDLAHLAVTAGTDALVVVGGDGLVHAALQVLGGTPTPLGIVPGGSGNDAARSLGLGHHSPEGAARVIAAGHTRRLDLARAEGRFFCTVLATGFDARVNERASNLGRRRRAWPPGPSRYLLAVAAELPRFRPLPYTLDLEGEQRRLDAMLVAVGNGPSYGGGLRICAGALLDDGLLDVVVIKPLSRRELVRVFPRLYTGSHVRHPRYEHHRVRRVSVAAPAGLAYADGERLGPLPTTVECVPQAITVLVGTGGCST
ncbi:MAG TPA: diacylglycerol kinase family protein [Nocardioidaceae bacterium]|nr:diacylglycerol kinase family protein [Nocardioidaceae bacterium]